jgi:hypothetical protein
MKTAIAQIKELVAKTGRTRISITVTHADVPTNDWTTLFQTVLSPEKYSCRWVIHLMLISKKQK